MFFGALTSEAKQNELQSSVINQRLCFCKRQFYLSCHNHTACGRHPVIRHLIQVLTGKTKDGGSQMSCAEQQNHFAALR